jgi:acyl carrier protein
MRRSTLLDYSNKEIVCNVILEKLLDKSGLDLRFKNYDEIKGFKLGNDLGLDSLDRVELMMELEVEFKINILDEEFESVDSIDDLMELVYKKNLVHNPQFNF